LDNNRLKGTIPVELAKLRNLKILRLGSNQLTGEIPTELDKLNNLEDNNSNFKWNGLDTQKIDLKSFLKKKQIGGDWQSTQTIAPSDIKFVDFTEDTITINWQPISYTSDTGSYQVFYREEGQPYNDRYVEDAADKMVTEVSLKGLKKCTKYHFKIRTWTDSHRMNANRIESPFSNEFTAATRGIIIAGSIKNQKDGKGFPGVQLTASNGGGNAETDKDGKYKLSVIPEWTGTVTPSKKGVKFSPPSMNYDIEVTKDISGKDYTAESHTVISGKVTYNGKGVGDVTLKFTVENGNNYTALTDEDGNYEKEVSYNWSGSVTPIKDRHPFNPKERKYQKVTSPHEEQNYEVQLPKIIGQVKNLRGKGISGVRLKFSNVETEKFKYLKDYSITDEKGNYEIFLLENWIGNVTPESSQKNKYIFYPPSRKIKKFEDAKKLLNFKAWRNFRFFLSITGNIEYFTDNNDNDNYYYLGEEIIYPEITLGYKFIWKVYIWSGFEFISRRLNSYIYEDLSIWLQQSFSFGIGYSDFLLKSKNPFLYVFFKVGVVQLRYKKGNFDDKIQAKSLGLMLEVDIIFNITDRWFMGIPFGAQFLEHFSNPKIGCSMGYRF
jgi:hypothetical protein